MKKSWAHTIAVALLVFGLGACADLQQASEDATSAASSIRAELGVDAQVGFRVMKRTDGSHTTVSVHLEQAPPGDSAQAKEKIAAIVRRSFRSGVDKIVIVF